METGKLIFVTGGVRSGKSSIAENMAINLSREMEADLHYVACGVPSDQEMAERIAHHQENRTNASIRWKTWECPYQLQRISSRFSKRDILVLDCVTTLLNNYLVECSTDRPDRMQDCILTDITSLHKASAGLVVVSNEVAQGIPYQEPFIRNYQHILGNVHQNVVDHADAAYLVENGVAICKKGAPQ